MSAISLKSITGITSITTPAGVDNQLTLHNNNTTEAVKLDIAGNLHFHNHLNITGVSTASNFKTGTSNLHNTGLNVFDLDVDGHTNLDNVSIAGITTTTSNIEIKGNSKYLKLGASDQFAFVTVGAQSFITNTTGHLTGRSASYTWENVDGTTEYFRIASNGRVGVNTTNPQTTLYSMNEIAAGDGNRQFIGMEAKTVNGTPVGEIRTTYYSGASGAYPQMRFVTSDTERLRIGTDGKIGIQTTTGSGLINTLNGGTNQQVLHIRADLGSSNGRSLNLYTPDTDNTNAPFRFQTGNGYLFQCDSENVFTIAHDRKIGINQLTPTAELEVAPVSPNTTSTIFIHAPTHNTNVVSEAILKFGYGHSGSPDGEGYIKMVEDATNSFDADFRIGLPTNNNSGGSTTNERLRITSEGNIGIGGITNPQEKVQIAGNISLGNRSDGASRYIGKGTNGSGGVIGDSSANPNSGWIGFVSGSGTGAEDQIRFGTLKSGTSGGERMRLDGLGRLSIGSALGTHNDPSELIKIQQNTASAVLSIIGSNNTHSTLALGDEDDFNRARIRADHTHDLLGFWTADAERLRITDKGVLSSFLTTTGGHNTGNAYYHRPVLEITHNSATPPTQVKILTNISYTGDGTHAHSVTIRGFRYGGRDTVDIQICWHVYAGQFYNRVATSSGSYAPTITLAVESGKVVIHLTNPGYWPKFYVESLYHPYGSKEQAEGWSWTDNAVNGDSGTPVNTVPYKWDAGGLSFNEDHNNNGQGSLTINDGNLVIGTSGHGISFSATGNGSGASGISELLDDYEFGDFTPTIHTNTNINSTSGENDSHTGAGQYTKVGKMVTVTVDFNALHTNARDHVLRYISGLPFTSRSNNKTTAAIGYQRGLRFVYGSDVFDNESGRYHHLYGHIGGSSTNIQLNGSMSYSPYSGWPATHDSGSSQYMRITLSYFTS